MDEDDKDMDEKIKDMICDIGELSYMKAHFMILFVATKMCLYIRGAPFLHDCLSC